MALAAQALEAQKASKPLEQGGALEQVAARIKRVMGLTFEFTGLRGFIAQRPLERSVRQTRTIDWLASRVASAESQEAKTVAQSRKPE